MSRVKTLLLALLFGGLIGCGGGDWSSGDRVLVAKCLYDTQVMQPKRYDVVVFKFPDRPVEKHTPKNYIKRLIGLPGEIIAIFFGRLHRWGPQEGQELPFRKEDEDVDVFKLRQYPHHNHAFSEKLFKEGQFHILRKPPDVMMALRRIVFDNDYLPKDLEGMVDPRWNAAKTKAWKSIEAGRSFVHKGDAEAMDWLRYQHLVVERSGEKPAAGGQVVKPQLITDRIGYNSFALLKPQFLGNPAMAEQIAKLPLDQIADDQTPSPNWVGDLMLECNVEVEKAQGELSFELSKSIYRYQAHFDLATGVCTLTRVDLQGNVEKLDSKPTSLKGTGSHLVRFANFDARLTVWVDRDLPFGEGHGYPPPEVRVVGEDISDKALLERCGPTMNDLEPASIGSKGAAVTVKHVRLWRDTYYTTSHRGPDFGGPPDHVMPKEAWSDPKSWEPLKKQTFSTFYVQPGHYLCLGDNSTASSDGRDWGLVPQRLLLGRALAVYYPVHRIGPIR